MRFKKPPNPKISTFELILQMIAFMKQTLFITTLLLFTTFWCSRPVFSQTEEPEEEDYFDGFMGNFLDDILKEMLFSFRDEKTNLIGFTRDGEMIVSPKYTDYKYGGLDQYHVAIKGKWGSINAQGKEFIPLKYDSLTAFNEERCFVLSASKFALFDTSGTMLVKPTFTDVQEFSYGLAGVSNKDHLFGYINLSGVQVIPFQYAIAFPFTENVALVAKKGTGKTNPSDYFLIDKSGNRLQNTGYQNGFPLSGDNFAVQGTNGLWYVVDAQGRQLIPPTYADMRPIRGQYQTHGLSPYFVQITDNSGKYGVFTSGEGEVFSCEYDDLSVGTLSRVVARHMTGKWHFLTYKGEIRHTNYTSQRLSFNNGVVPVVNTANRWGLINDEGTLLIPFEYDTIDHLSSSEEICATVTANGTTVNHYYDLKGERLR